MATTAVHQEFQTVAIEMLRPSPTNPRKIFDEKSMIELTASIKRKGVLVPLIVRRINMDAFKGHIVPANAQLLEIVAGERRYRAAKAAGQVMIPIRLRDMSDDEVLEIQAIENLQREDVHPLDEADGYQRLKDLGNSIQQIALKVNKPIEYVTRRLRLTALITHSRNAYLLNLLTIDHALLLAKLGPSEQEAALRYAIDRYVTTKAKTEDVIHEAHIERTDKHADFWEPTSIGSLRSHIECALQLELKKAPWDLKDAELVASAGACTTCPSNTAYNTALFGDLAIEDATCTDANCFNAKKQAFVQLKIEATKVSTVKEAGPVVKISHKQTSVKPRTYKAPKHTKNHVECPGCEALNLPKQPEFDMDQAFRAGQWVEAKKGECPNVIAGITVDFDETYGGTAKPGVKKFVCVTSKCKVHKKSYEKSAKSSSGRSTYNAAAEEQKRKELETSTAAETELRVKQVKLALEKVTKLTPDVLRSVAADLIGNWQNAISVMLIGQGAKARVLKLDTNSSEFARIVVASVLADQVQAYSYHHAAFSSDRSKLFAKLKLFTGYDAAAAMKASSKSDDKPKAKAAAKGKK